VTEHSEQGAQSVEDTAPGEQPTVDEVLERQRSEHPEQAATSTLQQPSATAMGSGDQPPDPVDVEAAEIDPRSPEAPEQIEELREEAEALGRDVKDPPA
jgi:hypothetical protein